MYDRSLVQSRSCVVIKLLDQKERCVNNKMVSDSTKETKMGGKGRWAMERKTTLVRSKNYAEGKEGKQPWTVSDHRGDWKWTENQNFFFFNKV